MQQAVKSFAKLVEVVLVILMALMVLVVFFATVGRYTQLFSIPWSEEFPATAWSLSSISDLCSPRSQNNISSWNSSR